jgi:hypothetical protein
MEVSGQLHDPAALPPRKRAPGTLWIGVWVDPRAVLDAVVKRNIPIPRRESSPRTPKICCLMFLCKYMAFVCVLLYLSHCVCLLNIPSLHALNFGYYCECKGRYKKSIGKILGKIRKHAKIWS